MSIKSALVAAGLALLAIALGGCGGDDETGPATTTTAAGTTGGTGATGATGADGQKTDIEGITTLLEDAGFDVTEQSGGDLEVIGADNLTAEAGVVAARPGAGDVVVQVFATEDDANTAKQANSQGFTTAEAEGTVVITATEKNDELQNEVAAVVFGR